MKSGLLHSKNPTIERAVLALKDAERKLVSGKWTFVSFEEMTAWSLEWADRLPRPDLVIAVPRSGLLPGVIVALRKGVPLSTPEIPPGSEWASSHIPRSETHRILLVDDSVATGKSLADAKAIVQESYPSALIETAALIVSKESKDLVDYAGITIESPRVFEWNFLHSKKGKAAFDLDGVIAEEPEQGLREDDTRYRAWIRAAKPFLIPTYTIDVIISNRPESVREETEVWLKKYGVQYTDLILAPEESHGGKHAHKTAILRATKPDIFFESSPSEAATISREARVPVLCVPERKIYNP